MKANAASIDITPSRAVDMGAGRRASDVQLRHPVKEPLEANALALWGSEDEHPVLFLSLDLLYVGAELRAAAELVAGDLPKDRMLLFASHTHQAPMADSSKPKLGEPDGEYMQWIKSSLADLIGYVLNPQHAEEAHISVGSGEAKHSINRRRKKLFFLARRPKFNFVAAAPNPRGMTDEMVSVINVQAGGGKLIASIWNYACHPVAHPEPRKYSSHFPHQVRLALRRPASSATPVLFMQGFSGNTRPNASVGARTLKERARRLVSGPLFDAMSKTSYDEWVHTLASLVSQVSLSATNITAETISTIRTTQPGFKFADELQEGVSFHSVLIGKDICIVGVGGEVVAEYAPWVRERTQSRFTLCVGCVDVVFGYIPTKRMLDEGGYESHGFCRSFGIRALHPEIEATTRAGFEAVLPPAIQKVVNHY